MALYYNQSEHRVHLIYVSKYKELNLVINKNFLRMCKHELYKRVLFSSIFMIVQVYVTAMEFL